MTTLIAIVDLIVLLMYIAHIPRVVSKSPGSTLLSVFIAVAIAIFAMVSFIANAGLVAATSSFMQALILLGLVVMAALVRATWSSAA